MWRASWVVIGGLGAGWGYKCWLRGETKLTSNMRILLVFGLVAVALAEITRFEG